MSIDEKIKVIADTLNVDRDILNADTVLTSLDEWDSMGKISIIVMFDKRFKREIGEEQISKLQIIRDILNLMELFHQ